MQKQPEALKAKKLNIDFDALGDEKQNNGYGTTEEEHEEVKVQPKKEIVKPVIQSKPVTVNEKLKNMKAISSTDYE